jgi:predicted RNA-binding protein YlxR (DUF448 family)
MTVKPQQATQPVYPATKVGGQRLFRKALRSCVACRTTDDKQAFIRFVRVGAEEVACDPTGRQSGRGAYLCDEPRCFERAREKHLLERALKVKLSEADYARLEAEFITLSFERAQSASSARIQVASSARAQAAKTQASSGWTDKESVSSNRRFRRDDMV